MSQSSKSYQSRISPGAWFIVFMMVVFFAVSHMGRMWLAQKAQEQADTRDKKSEENDARPSRLVALAPSNVETLFAMGLGDHVVGISRFSSYPPEALVLPQVCGYVDVDFERLLSLNPDCVVMVDSQHSLVKKFDELGISSVSVDHASLNGVIDGFSKIAQVCGNEKEAREVASKMRARIAKVKKRVAGKSRPSVLVCIHHETETLQPNQIVIAGNKGFHQDLIKLAGGVNAYQGEVAFPKLSREKLINLNPDVILVLTRDETLKNHTEKELVDVWRVFHELGAVKGNRVKLVIGNEHFIPGPRLIQTLDAFADALHP